ncbi:MAG: hypothetical protein U0996_13590 [Planctomycetaceae bacterium]
MLQTGCSDSPPPARQPTVAETAEQVCVQYRQIRDGFENRNEDAAHDPLHEVGYALQDLEAAAKRELKDESKLAALTKLTASLFEDFGAVDRTMHGREGSSWAEVSERIATSITELRSLASLSPEPPPKKKELSAETGSGAVQPEPAPEPAAEPAAAEPAATN